MSIKKLFLARTGLVAMLGTVIAAVIEPSGLGEAAPYADTLAGGEATATLAFVKMMAGYGPALLVIGLGLAATLGVIVGLPVLVVLGFAALARRMKPIR